MVSSYNIFAGTWESGAGAIFAENQALAWLVELLGWPQTAGGCFISAAPPATSPPSLPPGSSPETSAAGIRWANGGWRALRRRILVHAAAAVLDAEVVIVPENDRGQLTGEALRSR